MNVIDAVRQRRATKKFDPDFVIPLNEKKALLSLAMENAPSAFNLQHWRPLLVEDPAQRRNIRKVGWDQPQMTDASMLVILCGDVAAWSSRPREIWRDADPLVRDFMVNAVDNYYRGKPETQRDEIMRSAGIFAQTLMLLAKAQGYDSCPMDGFDFNVVAEVIDLPENYEICLMVAIGKSAGEPYPRIGKLPFDQLVSIDRFHPDMP